jgi:hypothetical protein
MIYTSVEEYVSSCSDLQEELAAINAIMASMRAAMLKASTTGHFEQYRFDDGQTKIETIYRDPVALEKSYEGLRRQKKIIMADINNNRAGRVHRLIDIKNIRNDI